MDPTDADKCTAFVMVANGPFTDLMASNGRPRATNRPSCWVSIRRVNSQASVMCERDVLSMCVCARLTHMLAGIHRADKFLFWCWQRCNAVPVRKLDAAAAAGADQQRQNLLQLPASCVCDVPVSMPSQGVVACADRQTAIMMH